MKCRVALWFNRKSYEGIIEIPTLEYDQTVLRVGTEFELLSKKGSYVVLRVGSMRKTHDNYPGVEYEISVDVIGGDLREGQTPEELYTEVGLTKQEKFPVWYSWHSSEDLEVVEIV